MDFAGKFIAAMTLAASLSFSATAFAEPDSHASKIMRRLPVEVIDTGGTLIFSDSPEYVDRDGILYADTVTGNARILFYHLNNSAENKKLAVIVENVFGLKNTVEITRGGFTAPDKNFLLVGKSTQMMYMKNNFHDTIKLSKRERKLFQPEMDSVVIEPGNLIYGVYDFKTKGPVKISVLMYPEDLNPLNFLNHAKILPKDEQKLRGTFKNMNREIRLKREYDPKTDGIGYVLLGGDVKDPFKKGIDATDGSEVTNVGNYGINYRLDFQTKAKTRFLLSPLGGTYAGVMRFICGEKSGTIPTPEGRLYFGEKTPRESDSVRIAREEGLSLFTNYVEISELGSYSGRVSFEYSPPGASNLPVNIVLMPAE